MKRVPLSRAYEAHGDKTRVALISEPTGGLYLDHGEPYETQRSAIGLPVLIENRDAVAAYIEALTAFEGVEEPAAILRQLSIADIRAVKDAVLGFFEVAGKSDASSTSSPSAPDGLPVTSSE